MSPRTSAVCTLLAAGDVAPRAGREDKVVRPDGPSVQKADVAFVNLEHSLSRGGRPVLGKLRIHRGAPS